MYITEHLFPFSIIFRLIDFDILDFVCALLLTPDDMFGQPIGKKRLILEQLFK